MAKGKRRPGNNKNIRSGKSKPYVWNIVTVIAVILSVGLIVNLIFFNNPTANTNTGGNSALSSSLESSDARVQLVASKFKCACGGCGELPLIECTCDMPKGAKEEKDFIRNQFSKGLTVDQVIRAVQDKYGHLIS